MRGLYECDCICASAGEFTLLEIFPLTFSRIGITGSKHRVELPNEWTSKSSTVRNEQSEFQQRRQLTERATNCPTDRREHEVRNIRSASLRKELDKPRYDQRNKKQKDWNNQRWCSKRAHMRLLLLVVLDINIYGCRMWATHPHPLWYLLLSMNLLFFYLIRCLCISFSVHVFVCL